MGLRKYLEVSGARQGLSGTFQGVPGEYQKISMRASRYHSGYLGVSEAFQGVSWGPWGLWGTPESLRGYFREFRSTSGGPRGLNASKRP